MTKISFKEKLKKTDKQLQAVKTISKNRVTLLEGGSRSGKTFISLFVIIVRAFLVPNSRHLIARFRFSHAKRAICHDTMPKLLRMLGISKLIHLNRTDWFYTFPNGSEIWVAGLDDKDRLEQILGTEWSTIFLNEASQLSFDAYEILITRLNAQEGISGKVLIDYNPPSIRHWGYKMFIKRQFPDGRPVPDDDYAVVKMNPGDNVQNLSDGYIDGLENLSAAKRRRFLLGEYGLDTGKLWKRSWIQYKQDIHKYLDRIVVGVDPSGSVGGDEVGIVVSGRKGDDYFVLDDYSLHGTPNEWASEVIAAYDKWAADVIIAEKNFGGDMVESTIKNAGDHANVKLITSSRGKVIRAEPISALYEKMKVKHRIPFNDLEDELCTFDPNEDTKSPNRMDALVFSLAELSGKRVGMSFPDELRSGLAARRG